MITATGGLLPIPPNLEETTDGRTEMSTAESTDVERLCALIPMDTKESVLEEPMADQTVPMIMVIETTADSLETETSEMDKEEDKLAAQTMINGTGI